MLPHLIFWVGAAADFWTTRKGLKNGFREGNPVIKYVMDKLPYDSEAELMGLKVVVWVAGWAFGAPAAYFWVLGGLQLLAALWNFRLLKKAGVL